MNLAHLEKLARTRLDDVLVEECGFDRDRVAEVQFQQETTGKQIGQILVETDALTEYDLAKIVVSHYSLPFLDLTGFTTRREVIALLPEDYCVRHGVIALDQFGDALTLGVCEMPPFELIEDVATRTNLMPFLFVVTRRALTEALDQGAKRASKASAKRSTKIGPVPTEAAATESDGTEDDPDLPLPDLVLPPVSMTLVGAAAGPAKAPPPPPARPGTRSSIVARPSAPPPEGPPKFKPAGPGQNGAGAWQSIFESGENAVKRETTGGMKLPRAPTKAS